MLYDCVYTNLYERGYLLSRSATVLRYALVIIRNNYDSTEFHGLKLMNVGFN